MKSIITDRDLNRAVLAALAIILLETALGVGVLYVVFHAARYVWGS